MHRQTNEKQMTNVTNLYRQLYILEFACKLYLIYFNHQKFVIRINIL